MNFYVNITSDESVQIALHLLDNLRRPIRSLRQTRFRDRPKGGHPSILVDRQRMKGNVDSRGKEGVEEMESVDLIQNRSDCIPYTDTPPKTVSTQSIQKSESVLDSRVAGAVRNDGCLSIHQILPDPEEVADFLVLQKSDSILGVTIPSA